MISIKFTSPVKWPTHFKQTPKWDKSVNATFKPGLSMLDALTMLQHELDAMKVQNATLNTAYENIGNPRQIKRVGNDDAVVLQIKVNDKLYTLACDRWVATEQNIYALYLALQHMRNVVGWGVGTFETVFGGFSDQTVASRESYVTKPNTGERISERRNQSQPPTLHEWQAELGLGPTATLEDAHAVYRRRAKLVAGNEAELLKLNLAMEQASKALESE